MKLTYLLSMLVFAPLMLLAQSKEVALYEAVYNFSHIRDTADKAKVYKEQMILFIGNNSSEYRSYTLLLGDSAMFREMKKNPGSIPVPTARGSRTVLYHFDRERKTFQQDRLFKDFVFPLPHPEIDWKISSDTMAIKGIACQKATGAWKGRTYTAWFAPAIPFRSGPWKLRGLPGLILKAYDEKKEVLFDFNGFTKYAGPQRLIQADPQHTVITKDDYAKMERAMFDDPNTFLETMLPGTRVITPLSARKPLVIKNPIELTVN